MRELLYQAYLRYPRAFYDRHATGQVVSRATNDLYPDPLLHRLGHDAGHPVDDDDRRDRGRPVLRQRQARRGRARSRCRRCSCSHSPSRRKVMPISRQVQQLKADVTEAADEAVVGHRDGAGIRPRGRRPGAVRPEGRARARRRAAPGARRGRVPARPALPADALDRSRGPLRRARRDRRHAHLRRVLPLLPTAPAARLAARGARLDPLARPARDRLGVAQLRLAAGDRDRSRSRHTRRPLPAGELGVRFEDVHFSYGLGSRGALRRRARDRSRAR